MARLAGSIFTVSLFVVLVIYIRLFRNHYQVGI